MAFLHGTHCLPKFPLRGFQNGINTLKAVVDVGFFSNILAKNVMAIFYVSCLCPLLALLQVKYNV